MSETTEWFEGRQVDEQPQQPWPPVPSAWRMWAAISLVLILAPILLGCTTPACNVPKMSVLDTEDGRLYVFDEENLRIEMERTSSLAAGRCALRRRDAI